MSLVERFPEASNLVSLTSYLENAKLDGCPVFQVAIGQMVVRLELVAIDQSTAALDGAEKIELPDLLKLMVATWSNNLAYLSSSHGRRTTRDVAVQLSERERQVLKLVVEGFSNPEIASTLYLSVNTIKTHVCNLMNKLGVDRRIQLAAVAVRAGLV